MGFTDQTTVAQPAGPPAYSPPPSGSAHAGAPASPAAPPPPVQYDPPKSAPKRKTYCALLSGSATKFSGRVIPRRIHVIALLGGVDLDLRGGYLQGGETRVRCYTLMGGVNIRAPLDFPIEVEGCAVCGGYADARGQPHPPQIGVHPSPPPVNPQQPPGAVVIMSGLSIMGGASITDW